MIRNPFQALVSYYRNRVLGFHSQAVLTSNQREENIGVSANQRRENIGVFYTPEFEEFAYKHVKKWRLVVEDWVKTGDVHVVHFENVLDDKIGELEKMLSFLNLKPDKDRLDCLLQADVNIFKRKSSKLVHSPYSAELARTIQANIETVDRVLVRYGHTGIPHHKYGKDRVFKGEGTNVEWEGGLGAYFGPSLYTDTKGSFHFGTKK